MTKEQLLQHLENLTKTSGLAAMSKQDHINCEASAKALREFIESSNPEPVTE